MQQYFFSFCGKAVNSSNCGKYLNRRHFESTRKSTQMHIARDIKPTTPSPTIHRVHPSSLTFRIRRVYYHSNESRAPIANPLNSAQLGGTSCHFSNLHQCACSSVGGEGQTHRHTHTRTGATIIHFAWLCLLRNVIIIGPSIQT